MTSLMFLDAPSLIYRAFFSVPKTITDPSGQPVNAVRGFLDMIATLQAERQPDKIVAVMDADWRPQFRVDAYPGYKADRPEEPEELTPQFEMLPELLDAAGIRRAEAAGFEADDVIATLCHNVTDDDRAVVVTGDRDMLCLVRDPQVRILFTIKGVRVLESFDEAAVQEKYGVPPRLYSEFAMLRGDSSDGLPGVAGIGPVRAAKLLAERGSIEGILSDLSTLPPKQAEAFENARDYLAAVKKVVPPVTDVEVECSATDGPQAEKFMDMARERNLESPATRLLQAVWNS